MAEEGHQVTLNVYDLSQGLARQLSSSFLGRSIEGIWHTGVVVYGNEYYYGGGIQYTTAGRTPYGSPIKVVDLGVTFLPKDVFEAYLQEIGPRYSPEKYSLLTHNCNNFSNEIAQFLVGGSIPDYILELPNDVMNSPMGALILPLIQNLETTLKSGAVPQGPQFRPSPSNESGSANPTKKDNGTGDSKAQKPPSSAFQPENLEERVSKKDPLGGARMKVQDEIGREFAAIMATGTLRASEAAALATRRVMQRYSQMNLAA